MRQLLTPIALTAGLVLSAGAAASEVRFVGYTDGCFAAISCTPPNTSTPTQATSFEGLTYNNSTFDATTAGGYLGIGSPPTTPNFNNLGSFTLDSSPNTYNGERFDLMVTFTAPPQTAPNSVIFRDTLTGTVSSLDHGGVFVDLDNSPRSFTFDGGAFTFFVNDVSVTAGHTASVTGFISAVSAVPEPSTYAMLFAGLGVIGVAIRRRRAR